MKTCIFIAANYKLVAKSCLSKALFGILSFGGFVVSENEMACQSPEMEKKPHQTQITLMKSRAILLSPPLPTHTLLSLCCFNELGQHSILPMNQVLKKRFYSSSELLVGSGIHSLLPEVIIRVPKH